MPAKIDKNRADKRFYWSYFELQDEVIANSRDQARRRVANKIRDLRGQVHPVSFYMDTKDLKINTVPQDKVPQLDDDATRIFQSPTPEEGELAYRKLVVDRLGDDWTLHDCEAYKLGIHQPDFFIKKDRLTVSLTHIGDKVISNFDEQLEASYLQDKLESEGGKELLDRMDKGNPKHKPVPPQPGSAELELVLEAKKITDPEERKKKIWEALNHVST